MTLILHSGLSKDLSSILYKSDDFNVIIKVGENQNIKEFRAHSVILRARSPYFKSALSSNWITKKDNMIMFNKPNITPTVFGMILKYIYTGELDLTIQSGKDILELLVASDELLIEELFKQVHDYLIENQTSWIKQNFVLVLHTVFELDSYKKLQDYCLESICEDPQPLITSEAFTTLDKNILYYLLKRNDLQIEEVVAWDYLIKWGIEQTLGLSSDKTKWDNEDHEALKKTLSQFIPLIRFVEISRADFFDKVRPYRAVIPYDTYEDVTKFYYKKIPPKTAPRVGRIASTIIKQKLATIIANWIDRNESVLLPNNKYKFKLIYSMSHDGFNNVTFYDKCNGQGPFVILVRVQSKKIYGGYNPIGYANRNGWQSSTESFIFSFENDEDMHDMKIDRVIDANYSVYEHVNYVNFFNFGGHFSINGQILYSNYYGNYNNILGAFNLPIEEIEVFSVIKK